MQSPQENSSNRRPMNMLYYARKLKSAGFTQEQAEIQAEALQQFIEGKLATQQDLKHLELMLDSKIEQTKLELKADIDQTKLELKSDMAQQESRLRVEIEHNRAEIEKTRAEIEKTRLELKAEMDQTKLELKSDTVQLESRLRAEFNKLLFRLGSVIVGSVAVLGFALQFLKH